ncbi:MAG: RanBP2-type protein, partial [Chloroflexi bacterium]|nr:RanBP2-type protein [Chloroflexota bacterium]
MTGAADRRRTVALGGAALGLILAALIAGPMRAVDPTPGPTARPPTCADRYPADGPLGIDLMLGCIVNELISGRASGAEGAASAPRMSQW